MQKKGLKNIENMDASDMRFENKFIEINDIPIGISIFSLQE